MSDHTMKFSLVEKVVALTIDTNQRMDTAGHNELFDLRHTLWKKNVPQLKAQIDNFVAKKTA